MTNMTMRRLRLGLVGGGSPGSIGPSHVRAARLDGHWELVAGAFSRDAAACKAAADRYGVAPDRAYASFEDMAQAEALRPDRADAVTVCTHNPTHFAVADAFLAAGFHVLCDKPLAVTLAEARALQDRVRATGRILAVTYTYSGYPMVRMARDMIAEGRIGRVQSVQMAYAHHYTAQAPLSSGRYDPAASDTPGVVAALGSHAFHMAEMVSGLQVDTLAADLSALRGALDDHANILFRFAGGAKGSLWTTSVSHGTANGLQFRIIGSEGALSWHQESPDLLHFTPAGAQTMILTRGGPAVTAGAKAGTRIAEGHPEGYLEAFANIYSGVAAAIRGTPSVGEFPTVDDGARGVAFMTAALASARKDSAFVPLHAQG